ncbi:MAG: TetR/AcrR family transcriptional regulator [Burkholderiaceae bacterium]|nr:TetR/AcrR family transcriptional regulator [Burkholderiaceae bacterium]
MSTNRREQLLDTAVRLFYRQGSHVTGIDRLLAEAGVAKMTLYKHFKSKDDLIVAAAARMHDQHWARITAYLEAHGDTPRARLLALFDFFETWVQGTDFHGCPFVKLSVEHPAPDHPAHRAAAHYKAQQQAYFLGLAQEAGLPDPVAFTAHYMLLVEGAVVLAYVTGQPDPIRTARQAVLALLDRVGVTDAGSAVATH